MMPFIPGCYFSQVKSRNSNFQPPLPSMIKSIIKEVLGEGGQGDPEVFTILSAHHKHNNPLCLFLYMAAPRLEWTRIPCSHVASVSINVMPSPARLLLSVGRIVELSEGWVCCANLRGGSCHHPNERVAHGSGCSIMVPCIEHSMVVFHCLR